MCVYEAAGILSVCMALIHVHSPLLYHCYHMTQKLRQRAVERMEMQVQQESQNQVVIVIVIVVAAVSAQRTSEHCKELFYFVFSLVA